MKDKIDDQINIPLPKMWKKKLERIARTKGMKEDRQVSVSALIRDALNEKFNLEDNKKNHNSWFEGKLSDD